MGLFSFFISAFMLISNMFTNIGLVDRISSCKGIRRKIISDYIKSDDVSSATLSGEQLKILRKIYKKPFKDGHTYTVNGLLYYGAGSSQTRWFDLAVKGMRIETVHTPYDPASIDKISEFNGEEFNASSVVLDVEGKPDIDIEGVVYKDCLYVTKIDGVDLIAELQPGLSLKRRFSPVNIGFVFLFTAILFYFSWFVSWVEPTQGTTTFLSVTTTISIIISVITLYFITRVYTVKGTYKSRDCLYHEGKRLLSDQWVGTIGDVLVSSHYPLEEGKHYQALVKKESIYHTGLMDVEKLNGEPYLIEKESMTIVLCFFFVIQFIIAYSYYDFAKHDIQPELKPLYHHNVDRFGELALGQTINKIEQFDDIEVGDSLTIEKIFYSQISDHFLILEPDIVAKNKRLFGMFFMSCSSDNLFDWIERIKNTIRLNNVTFIFDSEQPSQRYDPRPYIRDKETMYEIMCRSPRDVIRYIACSDCSRYPHQSRQGIVTSIDTENLDIHLTNTIDINDYPVQIARYDASVIIMLASLFYMVIGLILVSMKYAIYRRNSSENITWT